ncbi:hypothetical protein OFQ46_01325 [Brachyspira hyodysenteriae]|nr:hypothetical protein [Brachyspira hyodysenteriae]MCZ9940616.1 hypothetical protein [Brachyspira hyodysenteriae]
MDLKTEKKDRRRFKNIRSSTVMATTRESKTTVLEKRLSRLKTSSLDIMKTAQKTEMVLFIKEKKTDEEIKNLGK